MDFDLGEDLTSLSTELDRLLKRYNDAASLGSTKTFVTSEDLERDLVDGGFLDVVNTEGLGVQGAGLLIEAVTRTPYAVEIAASALVIPLLGLGPVQRPFALARAPLDKPVRFLPVARTLVFEHDEKVYILEACDFTAAVSEGPFAFPYARPSKVNIANAKQAHATVHQLMHWWRLGLAFEIVGASQAALDLVVDYVKVRKQFGKPLGSLQVIKHRLSECAVFVSNARLLAQRAAFTRNPTDAALAAGYAQELAARVAYEAHQFHGAIGLTREYPLHHWTYRLRVLQGEIGGASDQYTAGVDALGVNSEQRSAAAV